jgi:multidrug efflux pump subunit AcrA (membrane-fusion protein)
MKEVIRRIRLIHLLAFLMTLAFIYGFFQFRDELGGSIATVLASAEAEPIPLRAMHPTDFRILIPAWGEVAGRNSEEVVTPETRRGGLTLAWIAEEGALVKAGDVVVRFDPTTALLDLERLQNTMAENEYNTTIQEGQQELQKKNLGLDTEIAKLDYDYSMEVLPEDQSIFSQWEIIEAELNASLAKDRIDLLEWRRGLQERVAESQLKVLDIDRERTARELSIVQETLRSMQLTAPKDGLLLYTRDRGREPQVGDTCYPDQALAEIVSLSSLDAQFYVLERDGGGLAAGKAVNLEFDAIHGRTFQGTMTSVSPVAQQRERNSPLRYFTCVASIEASEQDRRLLRPGMALRADVLLDEFPSCFVVPASAVTLKDGVPLVYVQSGDDFVPRPVDVRAGPQGQTIILKGLEDGEVLALRNPFEAPALHLPDFNSGAAALENRPGMNRRGMRRR